MQPADPSHNCPSCRLLRETVDSVSPSKCEHAHLTPNGCHALIRHRSIPVDSSYLTDIRRPVKLRQNLRCHVSGGEVDGEMIEITEGRREIERTEQIQDDEKRYR